MTESIIKSVLGLTSEEDYHIINDDLIVPLSKDKCKNYFFIQKGFEEVRIKSYKVFFENFKLPNNKKIKCKKTLPKGKKLYIKDNVLYIKTLSKKIIPLGTLEIHNACVFLNDNKEYTPICLVTQNIEKHIPYMIYYK